MTERDTKDKLKDDVYDFCNRFYTMEGRYNKMMELFKRQDALTRADCLPRGVEWPRFEDGELVRFGDVYESPSGKLNRADSVTFRRESWTIQQFDSVVNGMAREHGTPVKHPPVIAADGQPVEVGQTLYGEDGKAWEVERIAHGETHPVVATDADCNRRGLRPSWLTHEEPESIGKIRRELNALVFDKSADELIGVRAGGLQDLVERLERLEGRTR